MTTGAPPRNILVIQLGDIGDVVLTTASLRALKDRLPDARVHALVRKGCGALLAADPNLCGIFESRRGGGKLSDVARENLALVRSLRAERFDRPVFKRRLLGYIETRRREFHARPTC